MGINQGRPVLFLVLDDTVVAYEVFTADNDNDGESHGRYRRIARSYAKRGSLDRDIFETVEHIQKIASQATWAFASAVSR